MQAERTTQLNGFETKLLSCSSVESYIRLIKSGEKYGFFLRSTGNHTCKDHKELMEEVDLDWRKFYVCPCKH